MSQLCKYYPRGTCKYGTRCYFLHEDPQRKFSNGYSYDHLSQYNKVNWKNYNSNYNRGQTQAFNKDYSQSYSRDYSQNNDRNSSATFPNRNQTSNFNANFNRYHVDNRQIQNEPKSITNLSPAEFLDILNIELTQHEHSHMWPLSVIAPIKDFGNIPGFEDCSSEEVRYQYYEAIRNNNIYEFEKKMTEAHNGLVKARQTFKSKSCEAFNIVKAMMQQPKHSKTMDGDFSSKKSEFTFDLKKLNDNQFNESFVSTPSLSFPNQNSNSNHFPTSVPVFPSSNPVQSSFFQDQPSNFMSNQTQPQSQMNNFSFSLNNLQANQGTMALQNDNSIFSKSSTNNDTVYSKMENLPPETLALFQANSFIAGKVPLLPPPKQLCFS